jgi:hypothetical protein
VVHAVHGLPIGQQGVFRVAARQVAGPTGPLVVYAGAALGPSQRSVRVVVAGLSIGLPMMIALVAAVAWWLAGRALRPVEAVRAEVADIAGHEDLGRRGPRRGHEEIAKVAQTAVEVSGGTLKGRPVELAAAGEDSVLGYARIEAQRPGATIDQYVLQRFVVRNGKIVSLHNVYCDQDEVDAFYK